jgi:lysophospholipase L1-like esterase
MSQKPDAENLVPRLRNKENLRIIALGDSISFGVGDHGGHEEAVGPGWAGRFAHDMKATKFVNVSRNGARVRDITKHQLAAAIAGEFDLALICIGGNDVLRGNYNPVEIRNNLMHLILKLQSNGIAIALINLPHMTRPLPVPKFVRRIFELRAKTLNVLMKEVSNELGAELVSLDELPMIRDKSFWHSDRMHPSAIGHQLISDKVRRSLSLPRRVKKKLPCHDAHKSRWSGIRWLLVKGSVWVARRSIDLLPALIYLTIRELIFEPKWLKQSNLISITQEVSKSSFFVSDFEEQEVLTFTKYAYRAEVSSKSGFNKKDLNELISFPA